MRDRLYTILSTAALPFERIPHIPDTVDIRVIPFTKILALPDEKIKTQVADLSTQKITVVFTSAQAVKIVAGLLSQKPIWKIYCIRNETRAAVITWFGSESIIHYAGNALILSEQMISDGVKDAVFFCGDQRMDILPDNLKKHGIQLTELIVYETRLTPSLLEKQPDAILFFSPTAVRSFFSMNGLSPDVSVFVMGKTTGAALKQYTEIPFIISPESDKAFVLNMALENAGSHPTT
jgi:uroporphyrinogen-III synthase